MRKRAMTAAALAALLVLSACSDGAETPPETATTVEAVETEEPVEAVEPVETATPEPETATVQQWASKIAGVERGVRESIQAWDDEECMPVDLMLGDPFCNLNMISMRTNAQIVVLAIEGGTKEGVPAYVGDPPAEIEALVESTLERAQDAYTATEAAVESCGEETDECRKNATQAILAMGRLEGRLDAWGPYL